MRNIIVLDLETARSADDCRYCGYPMAEHTDRYRCLPDTGAAQPWQAERIGWDDKVRLGLSIGAYYDYATQRIKWFDVHTLEATVCSLVETQPLMVSFNGFNFDYPLMRAILRQRAEQFLKGGAQDAHDALQQLCDQFKALGAESYDILAEIWRAHEVSGLPRVKGVNTLDALAQANGLGGKLSHGAQAPRDWAAGRYADVLNYCQSDVLLTRALFEQICQGHPIRRSTGPAIVLPIPPMVSLELLMPTDCE